MMMSEAPKVSVIIPVYNAEKYLRQCLDSVINQTLQNIEIICIDDCSTDNSSKILAEYSGKDPRLKLIVYDVNKSASQARKDGVSLATGQYIMFMDADDSLEAAACKELVNYIDQYNVDILQFGTYVDAAKHVKKASVDWFKKFAAPYTDYLYGRDVFEACFAERKYRFNLWNKIYKADLCKKAFAQIKDGAFPKAQDLYAFFIIAWYAKSYYGIEQQYYHYNYGRGVTGGGRAMTIEELKRHCSQHLVAEQIYTFLVGKNAEEEYADVWEKMNNDLISECVNHWIKDIADEDGAQGFEVLVDSWGMNSLSRVINKSYSEYGQYIKNKITNGVKDLNNKTDKFLSFFNTKYIDSNDLKPPCGFNAVIPVVFATNDKYSVYAGVAIESIFQNATPQNYYRIYILHDELSSHHIEAFEALRYKQGSVKCVDVSELLESKDATLYERAHFTKEMYYRFLIAEIFYCYDKVIYLDCDLILNTDVADIIPDDMGTDLIAAVVNQAVDSRKKQIRKFFNIDPDRYVNSGVLVINVKKWCDENIGDRCFKLLKTMPLEKLIYCDQDILNVVCEGRIYYLDEAWNFYWHMVYGTPEFIEATRKIVEKIGDKFKILHFASNIKPWFLPNMPLSKYFWYYARKSCFYEEILFNGIGEMCINPLSNMLNQASVDTYFTGNTAKKDSEYKIELKRANTEIENIHKSASYRIGRFITYIPRKVRGGIRCYKEHGMGYTLGRVKAKFMGLFGGSDK